MIFIDCGHGGLKDGDYVTSPKKMYKFSDGFTIYEGVINRQIGSKLEKLLQDSDITFFSLCTHDPNDIPLKTRVDRINQIATANDWLLSIHSNAGGGRGFEVFTSVGETGSDEKASIIAKEYKKNFDFPFRQDMSDGDEDKEVNFYMLRKTVCDAVLVENLFFDNLEEAKYLSSDNGQWKIAETLFEAIKKIES